MWMSLAFTEASDFLIACLGVHFPDDHWMTFCCFHKSLHKDVMGSWDTNTHTHSDVSFYIYISYTFICMNKQDILQVHNTSPTIHISRYTDRSRFFTIYELQVSAQWLYTIYIFLFLQATQPASATNTHTYFHLSHECQSIDNGQQDK